MKQFVVICDDNRTHLSYLKQTIEEYDLKNQFVVTPFSEGVLLDKVLNTLPVDVVFLDMSMTGANSMHLAKRIRKMFPQSRIILMTESETFELGVYELGAAYYLAKPLMAHKIHAILDELSTHKEIPVISPLPVKWFSIHTKKRNIRIFTQDIRYFEKSQRKVIVHTVTDAWDFYGTFKEIRDQLDMAETFVQCHQGFIVNLTQVAILESDGLRLADKTWIPVSRRYRPHVEAAFDTNGLIIHKEKFPHEL